MPSFRVRKTVEGRDLDFSSLSGAQKFVRASDLRHYEIWETAPNFRLIEYGSTPTRIARSFSKVGDLVSTAGVGT